MSFMKPVIFQDVLAGRCRILRSEPYLPALGELLRKIGEEFSQYFAPAALRPQDASDNDKSLFRGQEVSGLDYPVSEILEGLSSRFSITRFSILIRSIEDSVQFRDRVALRERLGVNSNLHLRERSECLLHREGHLR